MSGTVTVSWNEPLNDVNGNPVPAGTAKAYLVSKASSNTGPWTGVGQVNAPSTSLAVGGVADGTYFFAVQAINADNNFGPMSTPLQVTVKTPAPILAAPSGVAVNVTYP